MPTHLVLANTHAPECGQHGVVAHRAVALPVARAREHVPAPARDRPQLVEDGDGLVQSRCRFIVYRNRTETETDFFVGKRNDVLRRVEGRTQDFEIAGREIYLDQNVLLAKNLTIFF